MLFQLRWWRGAEEGSAVLLDERTRYEDEANFHSLVAYDTRLFWSSSSGFEPTLFHVNEADVLGGSLDPFVVTSSGGPYALAVGVVGDRFYFQEVDGSLFAAPFETVENGETKTAELITAAAGEEQGEFPCEHVVSGGELFCVGDDDWRRVADESSIPRFEDAVLIIGGTRPYWWRLASEQLELGSVESAEPLATVALPSGASVEGVRAFGNEVLVRVTNDAEYEHWLVAPDKNESRKVGIPDFGDYVGFISDFAFTRAP